MDMPPISDGLGDCHGRVHGRFSGGIELAGKFGGCGAALVLQSANEGDRARCSVTSGARRKHDGRRFSRTYARPESASKICRRTSIRVPTIRYSFLLRPGLLHFRPRQGRHFAAPGGGHLPVVRFYDEVGGFDAAGPPNFRLYVSRRSPAGAAQGRRPANNAAAASVVAAGNSAIAGLGARSSTTSASAGFGPVRPLPPWFCLLPWQLAAPSCLPP